MEFSFKKDYRFQCQACGECCRVNSITLTDKEYTRFIGEVAPQHYDAGTLQMNFAPHEVRFHAGKCYFLKNNLCTIYERRFTTCRLLPLTLSALPTGELFINLIHCNGISASKGKRVNASFVETILRDIDSHDPEFLDHFVDNRAFLHSSLLPLFSRLELSPFSAKRCFIHKISRWLQHVSIKDTTIDVRCAVILETLNQRFKWKMSKLRQTLNVNFPIILSEDDVNSILNEVEDALQPSLTSLSETIVLQKTEELRKIVKAGKVEMIVDGARRMLNFRDYLPLIGPYGESTRIRVKSIFKERTMEPGATKLVDEYILEVLNRIDLGGFPMSMPIDRILNSLRRYAQFLLTYANAYSAAHQTISMDAIEKAIIYLDTRFLIAEAYKGSR